MVTIEIDTYNPESGKQTGETMSCDVSDWHAQKWLGKHIMWAVGQGLGVQVTGKPVERALTPQETYVSERAAYRVENNLPRGKEKLRGNI